MLLKPMLEWMSPAGPRARLSVLIFHRVLPESDVLIPDEMHARRFDGLCDWLASWFNVLPLDKAVSHMKVGTLPARAASITFDDGYADNYHLALPILKRHGLPATFFIATGFLDGGCMWNDRIIESVRACASKVLDLTDLDLGRHTLDCISDRRAAISTLIKQLKYRPAEQRAAIAEEIAHGALVPLPRDLMMTSQEVKALHEAGMQIGAHTITHPILAQLPENQARQEIEGSKHFLEALLDERINLFAYPNGKPSDDYTPQTADLVRSLDFDAAVSTRWGASDASADFFHIRRFTPWDSTRLRFGARMLANLHRT